MNNKLSVIVSAYNVEQYLAKCLDSLVNQTIKVMIIIINDSSSDNTQQIIDQYTKKYDNVESFTLDHSGIAAVRNFGLAKVKTPYFTFLDSDDYIELDAYEIMLSKIIKEDSDICVCNFDWVYPNSRRLEQEGPYNVGTDMMINLVATLWNKIYKTETFTDIPVLFPENLRYEDAYFLYACIPYIKKISFVDQSFISYIQREGSITHNHNDKVRDMIQVFTKLLDFYYLYEYFDSYKDELEYIFTKFFLGNSFLRTLQIKDKQLRKSILNDSYELLTNSFPKYYKNKYLKRKGLKNLYFRIVRPWNYHIFVFIIGIFKK